MQIGQYNFVSSVGRTRDMATTEASRVVEIGNGVSPAANPPAPPTVLEQARLGNLDLFQTELESGNHPLDFKAGRDQYFNRTPLHLVAMGGHDKIVKFILSHPWISREVVNAKDCFGYTPLHLAVRHSHVNVVRLLTMSFLVLPDRFLTVTSEPDDIGGFYGGCTPLHLAAESGHISIARLLLQQPCQVEFWYDPVNIYAMTWCQLTPLGLARRTKFQDMKDFLEELDPNREQQELDSNRVQQERKKIVTSANALLVGAALVVAATFSAWLSSPPNAGFGTPPSSPSSSSPLPSPDWESGTVFYFLIAFAFTSSMVSLGTGIMATFSHGDLAVNGLALKISRTCLISAFAFLGGAFTAGGQLVFGKVAWRDKFVLRISACLPIIAVLVIPICLNIVYVLKRLCAKCKQFFKIKCMFQCNRY